MKHGNMTYNTRGIHTCTEVVVAAAPQQYYVRFIKRVDVADGIPMEAWNGHYGNAELKHHAEYD